VKYHKKYQQNWFVILENLTKALNIIVHNYTGPFWFGNAKFSFDRAINPFFFLSSLYTPISFL